MHRRILPSAFGFISALLIFFSPQIKLWAQQEFPATVQPKDTVDFYYKFTRGDSLLYEIVSRDSIVQDENQPALVRERKEMILISCDSISSKGLFYLSQRLIGYSAKEWQGQTKQAVQYKESPWLGRKIWFSIDSTGKRFSFGAADTLRAALSPGGPFQPHLFLHIGSGRHLVNAGWLIDDTIDLPENAIPVPMLRNVTSYRARASQDTLGTKCLRFEQTSTAQGGYSSGIQGSTRRISSTSVIASFGRISLAASTRIPIHYFGTSEIKTTLSAGQSGHSKAIKHFVLSEYTLKKMVSPRGTWIFPQNANTAKPKSIKKKGRRN
jgi:hypothetical protein